MQRYSKRKTNSSPQPSGRLSPSNSGDLYPSWGEYARRWLSKRAATSAGLLDFVPQLSPELVAPLWLWQLAWAMDTADHSPCKVWFTVQPRHGKSELILHDIARTLLRDPTANVLYMTHTATFAAKQSKRARRLAKAAGVELMRDSNRADEWATAAGGGLVARGIGGEVTGRGFNRAYIDDPIKNRAEAESPTYRDKVWDSITDDILTRLTPAGSVFLVHTRWHPDDAIGRAVKEGWHGITRRAIAEPGDDDGRDAGEALAPALGWTAEVIRDRMRAVGEYGAASLFQGRPRKRGGAVFGPATFYNEIPGRLQYGHGVDLAYTAKTAADRSVCVTLGKQGDLFYVLDVISKQVEAPEFTLSLVSAYQKRPGRMLFLGSGTEKGPAQFIKRRLPKLEFAAARADKFVRSQEVAAAWNDGRVLLPDPVEFPCDWLPSFLEVVEGFTGINDARDDEVDGLVNAFRVLSRVRKVGRRNGPRLKRRM